jgi:hypothetical protein
MKGIGAAIGQWLPPGAAEYCSRITALEGLVRLSGGEAAMRRVRERASTTGLTYEQALTAELDP